MIEYEDVYANYKQTIELALDGFLRDKEDKVTEAMAYSLLSGGKRVRGILAMAVCEALGGNMDNALLAACSLEMIHAYSLIHDDLPCMDNDELRRGLPTCHIAFGETRAVLAGDGLLTKAFEVASYISDPVTAVNCIKLLAEASGHRGMIYGQELDTSVPEEERDEVVLTKINRFKTGALINASVKMGCYCAKASGDTFQRFSVYSDKLGQVFQIIDDILDATSTPDELGKSVRSDEKNGKITYASLYGIDTAAEKAALLTQECCDSLAEIDGDTSFLAEIARRLLIRKF